MPLQPRLPNSALRIDGVQTLDETKSGTPVVRLLMRSRSRIILVATTCVPLAGLIWWNLGPDPPRQPTLSLDKSEASLGRVLPGESLHAEFHIRNTGSAPLVISNLQSSCGCAPPRLEKSEIQPNGEALLTIAFLARPYAGRFAHVVSFDANDPRAAKVHVTVSATAEWPVEANPVQIHLTGIPRGVATSADLQLYSPNGAPFQVVNIETTVPWIRTLSDDASANRTSSRYKIEIVGQEYGPFSESITFITSSEKRSRVIVPVTGEVVAPRRITPERIVLGAIQSGAVKGIRLILHSDFEGATIKRMAINDPEWSIERWDQSPLNMHTILIQADVRLPKSAGYRRGILSVLPCDAESPLEVPIAGFFPIKSTRIIMGRRKTDS